MWRRCTVIVRPDLREHLIAGIVAGVAGMVVYVVLRSAWVEPAWEAAAVALPLAALSGAAIGWARYETREALSQGVWSATALATALLLVVAPAFVIQAARSPQEAGSSSYRVAELAVGAAIVGSLLAYLPTRRAAAAWTGAVGAVTYALTFGLDVPFVDASLADVARLGLLLFAANITIAMVQELLKARWTRSRLLREVAREALEEPELGPGLELETGAGP